ncbi:MAG: M20 family metallopeptidase [bacterium]
MKALSLTAPVLDEIKAQAHRVYKAQLDWRRHLHRHPELSYEEHRTTSYLRKQMQDLGAKIQRINLKTGLVADLAGHGRGPVVALRSDIDALPIAEQTKLPFASKTAGQMHACGHDMHMATLLGTAAVLSAMKADWSGTVRFIFQPAEEMPPGGALPMIEAGALDEVGMIFGLHVDPRLPTGRISLRDGDTMASVTDFNLVIRGTTGHGARPHDAVDAITTACEVVESLQKIISREVDPLAPAAITFGRIEGGVARNVIADRVQLWGTARALSPKIARRLPAMIKRTARAVGKAHGAEVEMSIVGDYPVLSNHSGANDVFRNCWRGLFARTPIAETEQVLGGEDFARYLQIVPGAMVRLGIGNPKIGADKPWHSPMFVADEKALPFGTALLAACCLEYLERSHE